MIFLFAAVVGSTFLLLVVWAVATVYRLYNPDHIPPFEEYSAIRRKAATAEGEERVPVGIREIRADQRRQRQKQEGQGASYTWGRSEGVPEAWFEELWRRRN